MKVKVIEENRKNMGDFSTVDLKPGKIYEAVKKEKGLKWYSIVDESGDKYLYPPELFEIAKEN